MSLADIRREAAVGCPFREYGWGAARLESANQTASLTSEVTVIASWVSRLAVGPWHRQTHLSLLRTIFVADEQALLTLFDRE